MKLLPHILISLILVTMCGANFTTLSTSLDWTDKAYLTELVTTYNEHKACIGQATSTLSYGVGVDAASHATFEEMQEWVDANYGSFVNHTATNIADNGILLWTNLTEFRTAAGLSNGWRKATTWPSDWTDYDDANYDYGECAAGHYCGDWLIVDLQNAFNTLRWTRDNPSLTNDYANNVYYSVGAQDSDRTNAWNEYQTNWPGSPPGGYYEWYKVYRTYEYDSTPGKGHRYSADRSSTTPISSNLYAGITASWDCWVRMKYMEKDLDNHGFPAAGKYMKWDSGNVSSGVAEANRLTGNSDTEDPMSLADAWDETTPTTNSGELVEIDYAGFVIKWDFSYKNY